MSIEPVTHPRFTIILPGAQKGKLSVLRDLWLVDVQKVLQRAGADPVSVGRIDRSPHNWEAGQSVIDDCGTVHFVLWCTGRITIEEREQRH